MRADRDSTGQLSGPGQEGGEPAVGARELRVHSPVPSAETQGARALIPGPPRLPIPGVSELEGGGVSAGASGTEQNLQEGK